MRALALAALGSLLACSSNDASSPSGNADAASESGFVSDAGGSDAPLPIDAANESGADASASKRDPLKQPFASSSIWNMPLGDAAKLVPAGLRSVPGGGSTWGLPSADQDQIILTPKAPLVDVRESSVGWGGGDRCAPTSSNVLVSAPIPPSFVVPNAMDNNSTAILASDGHTLVQVQPLARCSQGGVATSQVRFPDEDLYGDGIGGAHGGSGLSSIGGTLRLGELRPGSQGPRHALKLTMYMKDAFKCTKAQACFRWPAKNADSYAVGFYGTAAGNPSAANASLVMGALLALPPSVSIASLGLETEPAKQIAWTLQNYGAYIADDTYVAAFDFATEHSPDGSFVDQFKKDFGFDFVQPSTANQGWTRDLQRILPKLAIVDDNAPGNVGGAGKRVQPLAPAIP